MRVFLSDVLFDREQDGNKNVTISFGKQDCNLPQGSGEDTIQEFAPALRTSGQIEAFRLALQMLGDLTGFGIYAWTRIMLGNGTRLRSDA